MYSITTKRRCVFWTFNLYTEENELEKFVKPNKMQICDHSRTVTSNLDLRSETRNSDQHAPSVWLWQGLTQIKNCW